MEPEPVLITYEMSTKFHVSTTIYCTIVVPSLIANIFLLLIVCRSTAFRDLSTMLVTFISFVDILYIIYTSVYIIVRYMHIALPDAASTVCITVQSTLRMVPACTFFLIGYNWYLAAFKPASCYKFHQIPHVTLKCFLATWVVSLVVNAGVPFVIVGRFHKVAFLVYSLFVIVVFYLFPLIVEIILHLKNLRKTKIELQDPSKRKTLLNYNQKITQVFLILSICFFICTAPMLLYPLFDILSLKSSSFAVFIYHLISCLPCLMNPVCHYIISKKFKDELRGLFCMKPTSAENRPKREPEKPIAPEAFSANRGFFEPCTPSWRRGTEYWNRELIYGEYPSVAPQPQLEQPVKKRRPGIKDVRFSGVIEEIVAEDHEQACQPSSSKEPAQSIDATPEKESTCDLTMASKSDVVTKVDAPMVSSEAKIDAITTSKTRKPVSRSASHLGTWPRRDLNPLQRHNVADVKQEILLRAGASQPFRNRNALGRSKSFFVPSNANTDKERFSRKELRKISNPETPELQTGRVNDGYEQQTVTQTHL